MHHSFVTIHPRLVLLTLRGQRGSPAPFGLIHSLPTLCVCCRLLSSCVCSKHHVTSNLLYTGNINLNLPRACLSETPPSFPGSLFPTNVIFPQPGEFSRVIGSVALQAMESFSFSWSENVFILLSFFSLIHKASSLVS